MEKIPSFDNIKKIALRSVLGLSVSAAPFIYSRYENTPATEISQENQKSIDSAKNELSQKYLENGDIINQKDFFSKLNDIYIYEEYLGYSQREHKQVDTQKVFFKKINDGFFNKILKQIGTDIRIKNSEDALKLLLNIKKQFHKLLGDGAIFEKNHRNFVDPALENAFQCRSGTENLLYLLNQYTDNKSDFRLVYIHTDGHVLPGIFDLKTKKLYGVESTVSGDGIVDFGIISNININMIVTDYKYTIADSVISGIDNTRVVIMRGKNIKFGQENYTRDSETNESLRGVHQNNYSFGESLDKPGRNKLQNLNKILPINYNKYFTGATHSNSLNSKEMISNEIDVRINEYNAKYSKTIAYFWNRHARLINNKHKLKQEFKEEAQAIITEFGNYLKSSDAQEQYEFLSKELSKKDEYLSLRGPEDTYNIIFHNLELNLDEKYHNYPHIYERN